MSFRDFRKQEAKWQEIWEKEGWYPARNKLKVKSEKLKVRKKYVLVEFPYPSGEGLHIGHAFTMTGADVYARFQRLSGFNVLFPMGWDAFGLPTENYAIRTGIAPQKATAKNTDNFRRQMKKLAFSFDWSREINTSDPDYYAWTQWIFIQLFKRGLAYKEEKPINWCPSCKIGLANEEVVGGKCERCGTQAFKKNLSQWIVKITAYAERLLSGLEKTAFVPKVKAAQVNWIGKSEGARVKFKVQGSRFKVKELEIFTTRPDTLWGATFMVVAPEHWLAQELMRDNENIRGYIKASGEKSELERAELEKEKSGIFSGLYALNPVNNQKIPIWISDFVLISYGTGAIMSVPAHDQRDYAFAKKYNLPVIPVVKPPQKWDFNKKPYVQVDRGRMINSDFINNLRPKEAIEKTIAFLVKKKAGRPAVDYHLRDWVFSRQHYWGEPIPMINCPKCGWQPVDEKDLPVKLPEVEKYEPTDTGESPLANIKEWVNTACPKCKGKARRETDTMPNWAGSDWYFLAYAFAHKLKNYKFETLNSKQIKNFKNSKNSKLFRNSDLDIGISQNIFKASKDILKYWLPVDIYVGGDEHNTLHLLYSRFIYQFLHDLNLMPESIPEPYYWRLSHGVILGEDGSRMSKSRGNIVEPDKLWEKHGVDALRTYMMFMGPFEGTIVWNDNALRGVVRFLDRFHCFILKKRGKKSEQIRPALNRLINKVSQDLAVCQFNTSIAAMMEFLNEAEKENWQLKKEERLDLIKLLSPFAPYLTEELWEKLKGKKSVHWSAWPKVEKRQLIEKEVVLAVQVNGKLRGRIKIQSSMFNVQNEAEKLAKKEPKVAKYLKGKKIARIVLVPGKLINFVVS